MYTREAAQEKANQTPVDRMPEEQRAKAREVAARLDKATSHNENLAKTPTPAPADAMGNREAMRQNMTGQDKTAPAMSPTSAQSGQPATEKDHSQQQEKAPGKQAGRSQTLPRPRPSWER
jgi:hypothetical protein